MKRSIMKCLTGTLAMSMLLSSGPATSYVALAAAAPSADGISITEDSGVDVQLTESEVIGNLITQGRNLQSENAVCANSYEWVYIVDYFNEKYPTSSVYDDIFAALNKAKTFGAYYTNGTYYSKIIGYLTQLQKEIDEGTVEAADTEDVTLSDDDLDSTNDLLIDGFLMANKHSDLDEAYSWVIDCENLNESYPDSTMYDDFVTAIDDAKKRGMSYRDYAPYYEITGAIKAMQRITTGDYTFEDTILQSEFTGIKIATPPIRLTYWMNETFNPAGMQVNAIYKQLLSSGELKNVTVENVDYDVDTTSKLTVPSNVASQEYDIEVSVTDGDVTQTATQKITVKKKIVSNVLNDLFIVKSNNKVEYKENETFSADGLVVDAHYLVTYEDGMTEIQTKEDVPYTVDTTTPLRDTNKTWNISYTDGDVTKTITQSIKVIPYIVSTQLGSISIANPANTVSYTEGDTFDATGMTVNATYVNTWSNGKTDTFVKENVEYSVDTTTPLLVGNTSVAVTATDGSISAVTGQAITVAPKPAEPTTVTVKTNKLNKVVIKWSKVSGIKKYQVQYSTSKKFAKKKTVTKTVKKNKITLKKLKKGKTYYVRVRTVKKSHGKNVYSKYSKVVKITTKK